MAVPDAPGAPAPVLASIVTRSYLGMAEVLVSGYLEHNPGATVVLLVTDGVQPGDAVDGAELIGPDQLRLSARDLGEMALAYDALELATAVKPFLLAALIERFGRPVAYLDADVVVTGSFERVGELAAEHGVVLTPHTVDPFPRDGFGIDELTMLQSGVFNLGFIAVGPAAGPLLDWWAERTRWDALSAPDQGMFTDQRWIDLVPALFPHHIERSRGWNVAYWNLHERPLSRSHDGRLLAGGDPVLFLHLSGYDPDAPHLLSRYQGASPRILLSEHPLLREVCDDHRARLIVAGHPERRKEAYGYGHLAGEPIPQLVRRMARSSMLATGPDVAQPPWTAGGEAPLLGWLNRPVATAGGAVVTRLVLEVWSHRPDLQERFPEPLGADVAALAAWAEADERFTSVYGHLHLPDLAAASDPVAAPGRDESPRQESERRVEVAVVPPDLAARLDHLEWRLRVQQDRLDELTDVADQAEAERRSLEEELVTLQRTWLVRGSRLARRAYGSLRRRIRG